MVNDTLFYKPSGKFNVLRILLTFPVVLILLYLATRLYLFLLSANPLIFFNVFIFLFFLMILVILSAGLGIIGNSRNVTVSTLLGIIIGLAAIYLNWVLFIKGLYTRHEWEVIGYDIALRPLDLWNYIKTIGENGYYTIEDSRVSGTLLWGFWIIETLGLIVAPTYFAYYFSVTKVYCERCNEWAKEKEGVIVFQYDDESELKNCFLAQDLIFLQNVNKVKKNDETFYQIDAEWCDTCEQLHTMSLRKVKRTWDKKEKEELSTKTIFEDMIINKETHDDVFKVSKTKNLKI